jgi:hypothetical protein
VLIVFDITENLKRRLTWRTRTMTIRCRSTQWTLGSSTGISLKVWPETNCSPFLISLSWYGPHRKYHSCIQCRIEPPPPPPPPALAFRFYDVWMQLPSFALTAVHQTSAVLYITLICGGRKRLQWLFTRLSGVVGKFKSHGTCRSSVA